MAGAVIGWVMFAGIAGFAIGFIVARLSGDDSKKTDALEAELEKARTEAREYRKQVAEHFAVTAHHFNSMTANYRAIYEHLAKGAQTLCSGEGVGRLSMDASAEKLPEALDENIDQPGQDKSHQAAPEANNGQNDKPLAENSESEMKAGTEADSQQAAAEETAPETHDSTEGSREEIVSEGNPEETQKEIENGPGKGKDSATKKQAAEVKA